MNNGKQLQPHHYFVSLLFFGALILLYWNSIPDEFNLVRENRRFFDSDGEFIIRQFNRGSTHTHNDHLLYHIVAQLLFRLFEWLSPGSDNVLRSHKILSVWFGSMGVALIFIHIWKTSGSAVKGFLLSMFLAGFASYWFFSSTIDTYVPAVFFSILSILCAINCMDNQRLLNYGALGVALGVAFLFRTDNILLLILCLVVFSSRDNTGRKLITLALTGGLTAAVGYFLLVMTFYDVPIDGVITWALGAMSRSSRWGLLENLTGEYLARVTVAHLGYSIYFPGLEVTSSVSSYFALGPLSSLGAVFYVVTITYIFLAVLLRVIRYFDIGEFLLFIIAALWIVSRVVLYTWWDPYDPFLFSITSTPAVWLLAYLYYRGRDFHSWQICVSIALVVSIWMQNTSHLIVPIRLLPT